MKLLNSIVFTTLVVAVANAISEGSFQDKKDEQIGFVFELVRHGARAPIENRGIDQFKVWEEELTGEGRRERYLLGRFNRERYSEQY